MALHTEAFHVAVKRINNPHHSDSRHKNSCNNLQRRTAQTEGVSTGLKVAISSWC